MKRWPFGIFEVLRAPEKEEGGGDGSGDTGKVKIGGKEYTEAELSAALQLRDGLSDETVGKEIVETLARRMGILKEVKEEAAPKPGESKQATERRFQRLLKTKLGKDFEKFSDMVGPILDDAIEEYLAEAKESLKTESGATGWAGEVEKFTEDHTLTAEIETEMERLIKRNGGVPGGLKGKAAQEYLNDMYELAASKLGIKVDELEEDEEPARRAPKSRRRGIDEVPKFREIDRPKGVLTTDQIVEAAMRGQRFRN